MIHNNISGAILLFSLILTGVSCNEAGTGMSAVEYQEHIAEWDNDRLQRLKSPDGWVNLAGLFWLQEGENSIGSADFNDIVFPRGPREIGHITKEGNVIHFRPHSDVTIKADGVHFTGALRIFGENPDARLLTVDSLGFYIIQRGERTGIRLRDYLHPRLEALQYIERYPPDQEWIIKARFIEYDEDMTIMVPDVLGESRQESVPGVLEFEFNGEMRKLYPTGSNDNLFIIFADDTNAIDTYGGGRFLNAGGPDKDGYVSIDFNKAYNPPCAFSPYATCPLPPRENFLPFRIEAGEKAPRY